MCGEDAQACSGHLQFCYVQSGDAGYHPEQPLPMPNWAHEVGMAKKTQDSLSSREEVFFKGLFLPTDSSQPVKECLSGVWMPPQFGKLDERNCHLCGDISPFSWCVWGLSITSNVYFSPLIEIIQLLENKNHVFLANKVKNPFVSLCNSGSQTE
jgi:hypothetical protein